MASVKEISLPHGTIPSQSLGNINLQNAVMYVNENFSAVKEGVNDAVSAVNDALDAKAESDHDHAAAYAALDHTHGTDEITGLNSKLDAKAELNHEHSQYLSSLPTHYHDVSGIQGLAEQLQAKADATHTHTIANVENLSTELGVKASTSYVDQQISQLGSTTKTIADNEIESYGASKGDEETEGATPIDATAKAESETVAQKNTRVGTSVRYARADHKHVVDTETDSTKLDSLKQDGSGSGDTASFGSSSKVPRLDHSHPLNVAASGTPSDCVKSDGTASSGTSGYYARQDHVHKIPSLAASDITYGTGTAASALDNHEGRIDALENAPAPSAPVTSVNTKTGDVVLNADDVGALDDDDIGVSVQEHDSVLDAVASGGLYDATNGKHEMTGGAHYVATAPSSAQLLGVLANSTSVTLRSSIGCDMVTYDGTNTLDDVVESDGCIDGASHVYVGSDSGKWVKTTTDGALTASSESVATFDATSAPTNASIVSMDADGVLADECEIPTAASSTDDRVLAIKKGGTALSWEDRGGAMGTPTDNTGASVIGTGQAQSLSFVGWTSGGDNGLKIRLYALVYVDPNQTGRHYLEPIDIDISNNGVVRSVSKPTGNIAVRILA